MKLAVVGDPVAHSRSPELQRGFLDEAGIGGTYEAIRISRGDLARRLPKLRAAGYDGLNVTTPLKEEALAVCERADEIATFARAANTLWFDGEATIGANTDGIGALAALETALLATPSASGRSRATIEVTGRFVVVLGTGPTARAAAFALASAGVRIAIWSRRLAPARELASELALATNAGEIFVIDPVRARTMNVDEAPKPASDDIDAVLSTLPPDADLPAALRSLVAHAPCVIDANYGARATLGAALGRRDVHDGIVMLEAQGRASFEIWRARMPATS